MPNAYRARRDLTIPIVVGQDEDNEVTTGENFTAGSLIGAHQLTKYHREQVEAGNLDDLLEPVDMEESEINAGNRPNIMGEPEFGVFFPEHEAERTALQVYGHVTVPRDQELEALSSGEQHFADHMASVQEQGLDRRPVQEHMAQVEQRVPDHLLAGGETQAGMPHNRGPVENEYGAEQYDEESDIPASRPRPSLAPREAAQAEQEQENDQENEQEGDQQENEQGGRAERPRRRRNRQENEQENTEQPNAGQEG
jgi:hypothetical protein